MYHNQVKKENRLPSVEFSWSICVDFRWSIPVTSWWVVIVTSAVATRCGARSTAPSSPRSRTCLTRRRSTPCPSFSWPGHRWLTWTWRHTARWAPFTKNIYSSIDLVMEREREVDVIVYFVMTEVYITFYIIIVFFISYDISFRLNW